MLRIKLIILLYLIPLIFPASVFAHPVDEIGISVYDQKQTLEVGQKDIKLKIDLTFYAFEKMKLWASMNIDNDQNLTEKEKDSWMKKGKDASWIEISGKKHYFEADFVSIPNYDEFFSAKPVDISIVFTTKLKPESGDRITYFYKGKDKNLSEIQYDIKGTGGLKAEVLENAKDSVTFKVVRGNQEDSTKSNLPASDRLNGFLNKYVKVERISMGLFLTAVLVSFLIGMLHALTPGHGKAIVAGYLVGEKGTISHAFSLGLIITITHTASVFLLGLATLFLTEYIVPETVIKWISLVSGVLITVFGLFLLVTRSRKLIYPEKSRGAVEHSEFDEVLEHGHHHDENGHHHHNHSIQISWKNLLPLGISGGLVPCIDALAILVVAISLGKLMFGLVLLMAFSIGLASALIIGGVLVVVAKNRVLNRLHSFEKYEKYTSLASALIVTLLGIAIILGKPI